MDDIQKEGTNSTPTISTKVQDGTMEIRGKSYPENTFEFYQPFLDWLEGFSKSDHPQLTVTFEIQYFNSSSSKVFYDLFDILEEARKNGKTIVVNWEFDPENVSAEEAGEDFKEDFESIDFNLVSKAA
jgi:SiaC family regulatory phosphoprotein